MEFTTFLLILLNLLISTLALPQPSVQRPSVDLDTSINSTTLEQRNLDFVWCCVDMPDAHGWLPTANQNAGLNIDEVLSTGTVYVYQPRTCTPITCVAQASISICNDNDVTVQISTPQIASYAGAIQNVCGWHGKGFCGQAFSTIKFNIILRAQNCLG